MGIINQTQYQYYNTGQKFTATANQTEFLLTLDPLPTSKSKFDVFINNTEVDDDLYSYSQSGSNAGKVIFSAGRAAGDFIEVFLSNPVIAGNYRYISLTDIVANFMVSYVGKDKIIPRIKRTDVLFHAKRGIQEFSYDITKIEKIQEIEVPDSLSMPMPQDYVDYAQISRIDSLGVEHHLYPARLTSIPSEQADMDNVTATFVDDSLDDIDSLNAKANEYGGRFGINPELATRNGNFVIDEINGRIHFSADLVGKIITLKYVSDGMGTDAEMRVHKFTEEAIYKHVIYAVVSSRANTPEYVINRYKRDRFSAIRNAKLRLSNLNSRELTQVMRNKSKVIKH